MTVTDEPSRTHVGAITITRVVEGSPDTKSADFFTGPVADAFAQHSSWMPPSWTTAGDFVIVVSSFVVTVRGINILVDTGVGDWPSPGHPPGAPASDFLVALSRAGFEPADIDVVVATHLHFDHVGGNTRLSGEGAVEARFPDAEYLFGEVEWSRHVDSPVSERPGLANFDVAVRPLVESGRARLVRSDHVIVPGVRLRPAPGHTAGHLCVAIESDGEEAVVIGDLAHHPIQLSVPAVGCAFDEDGEAAATTRAASAAEWVERGTLVLGTHFPGSGMGVLRRVDDAVRFVEIG